MDMHGMLQIENEQHGGVTVHGSSVKERWTTGRYDGAGIIIKGMVSM